MTVKRRSSRHLATSRVALQLHQCLKCSYQTTHKSNYDRHMKMHNPQLECLLCKKKFSTIFTLKRHVETHREAEYECETCGKICKSESGLRYHQLQHRGKGHKCNMCHKVFYTKASFAGHLSQHSGVKPYKCDKCGKLFGYPNNLHYHKKYSCHGAFLHSKYSCKFCDVTLQNAKSLKDHVKGAHQGRLYHCRVCGKAYNWRAPLRYHEIHAHKDLSSTK